YDLLTGRPPFRADSPGETMRQVIELEPAPPRVLNAKVDRDLETISLKCLSKELRHRYESAQALADDLGRFLSHEPIQARPLGPLASAYRWATRDPMLTAVGILIGLLFVVMAVAVFIWRKDAREWVLDSASIAADLVESGLSDSGASLQRYLASPRADELK